MNTAALVKRQRRPVTYSLPQPEYANKHVGGVNAVDLGGEGSDSIFTGGRDGTVRMWDLSAGMPACARRFEGHGGWVNDVARVSSTHLASASSDHTVRLWDISEGSMSSSCAVALQGHTDYVMALACASERLEGKFASGGLNREIFLWDIERCLAINAAPSYLSVKNDGCVTALGGSKESIYALGMDGTGNLLVSGGTELALRVWDTRSAQKEGKLKGHTDNVRAIVVDTDGKKCVTASSDRTIRVWDIGEQRCVQTFAGMHTGSIWALACNRDFTRVYSGGIDARICVTSLRDRKSSLVANESAAILKLRLDESTRASGFAAHSSDGDLWTATASRSIKRWPTIIPGEDGSSANVEDSHGTPTSTSFSRRAAGLSLLRQPGTWFDVGSPGAFSFGGTTPRKFDNWGDPHDREPQDLVPSMEIIGVSPIVRHSVLKNKMEVLTQDSMGAIALWDVSRPTPIRTFDGVTDGSDFEILLENESLNPDVVVPSWFTCNTRSGSLAITLSPSSAFNAEAYASDLGIADAAPDERRNLGVEIIRLLMDEWVEKFTSSKPPRSTKRAFAEPLPSECAVSFAHPIDDSGRVCVKIREDFSGTPTERELLPKWFADHALNQAPEPESPKISFRLAPRAGSGLAEISPASVSAPKILGAQKIREYIAQKLDETDGGTSTDASALALWCAGQPVPSSATLAAALARVWKKSPPIELEYSN